MEYKKFKEILSKGECKNIDFKIECNAFVKGHEKDTAELVKDIVAMSNNGNIANYLIIGVSNDRTGYKAVENDKLTDDNLQTLCKDNIFPNPSIKLTRCSWEKVSDERHKNKNFVFIQIGPQARQCFRFGRDHIKYESKYCFKKNEVWIRREATSDLASPEEVKRLLEGKEPIAEMQLDNNTDYTRVTKYEFRSLIKEDLKNFIISKNGSFVQKKEFIDEKAYNSDVTWDIVTININGKSLRLIVAITEKCNKSADIRTFCKNVNVHHHGVLLISLGSITPSASDMCELKIKENWGWFCTNRRTLIGNFIADLETNSAGLTWWDDNETFCLALDKVVDTQTLYSKLNQAFNTIEEKKDIKTYTTGIYKYINTALKEWMEQGCPVYTEKNLYSPSEKPLPYGKTVKKMNKEEFIDCEKYGNRIMIKNEKMLKILKDIL